MLTVTINGKSYPAREGATVLEVARAVGIRIPTLCHHPAIEPYGACRLCLVEVSARGRRRMVTACSYPVRDGLEVFTETERVSRAREGIVQLLLARAPGSKALQALADSLGVKEARFEAVTRAERDCILCGLCVNVCRERIGAAAISFAGRGATRQVAAPFLEPPEACVGCGACAEVCPVGTIELRWLENSVEVLPFGARLPLARCRECGEPLGALPWYDHVRRRLAERSLDLPYLCHSCKRRLSATAAKAASLADSRVASVRAGLP